MVSTDDNQLSLKPMSLILSLGFFFPQHTIMGVRLKMTIRHVENRYAKWCILRAVGA